MKIAKKRSTSHQERREAIKKQLQYIKRNLSNVEKLIKGGANVDSLNKRQKTSLLVVKKVYEQQLEMWEKKTQSVPQRIVSVTQPHVRPIVRGKAGKPVLGKTEIGVKKEG